MIPGTLTADGLRSVLDYDAETGNFHWKVTRGRAIAGAQTGYKNARGYLIIRIDGKNYKAHRLAWLYVTGEWPANQIDHINNNPGDNRFCNLREATHSENMMNKSRYANNKSGFKGVHLHKQSKRWRARIRIDNKNISLGLFDTPQLAYAAYCSAAYKLHGEFARVA